MLAGRGSQGEAAERASPRFGSIDPIRFRSEDLFNFGAPRLRRRIVNGQTLPITFVKV